MELVTRSCSGTRAEAEAVEHGGDVPARGRGESGAPGAGGGDLLARGAGGVYELAGAREVGVGPGSAPLVRRCRGNPAGTRGDAEGELAGHLAEPRSER